MWIFRTSTRVALVSSRRDLDAPKRSRENPNPKTGMLGLTTRHVYKGDPPKTCKQVFGATPKIFIYRVGAEDDKEITKIVCVTCLAI